jgi:hypothetical protein
MSSTWHYPKDQRGTANVAPNVEPCADWAITENSPAIHELPGASGRSHVVSFEDEARYLELASSTLRDLAILAIDTGLRPNSELFPLEWENVELEPSDELPNGFIHVVRGKSKKLPATSRSPNAPKKSLCATSKKSGSNLYFRQWQNRPHRHRSACSRTRNRKI